MSLYVFNQQIQLCVQMCFSILLDTLERFAATSELTASFTEAMSTVGREVTRHLRSRLQAQYTGIFHRK